MEPGTSNELHLYIEKEHTRGFQSANCGLVRYLRLIHFTVGLHLVVFR